MIGARLNQRDVDVFVRKCNRFMHEVTVNLAESAGNSAEIYLNRVKNEIGTHDPYGTAIIAGGTEWPGLSDEWIAEKESTGGIIEMWAYTGDIQGSVRMYTDFSNRANLKAFAGIDKGNNESAYNNAVKNEYLHDRPLFGPVGNVIATEFETGNGYVFNQWKSAVINAVRTIWRA